MPTVILKQSSIDAIEDEIDSRKQKFEVPANRGFYI
jgi:hypothetical protein